MMDIKKRPSELGRGFRAAIPIALGYIPIAITFGLVAKNIGVPDYTAVLMSAIVFAGASQFVGIDLFFRGASTSEIVLTTFILNLRHLLMSSSISQRMEQGISRPWLAFMSYTLTDESFTVASLSGDKKISLKYALSLNFTAYGSWVASTAAGVYLASSIPESVKNSMSIALYAMFIGLLAPSMRGARPVLVVALGAMAIHSFLRWTPILSGLSTGWSIIIATVTASLIGAILYPKEVNGKHGQPPDTDTSDGSGHLSPPDAASGITERP